MGFMDAVKGLFQSDLVQGALGSTPVGDLGEQLASPLGDAASGIEAVGAEVGQVGEAVSAEVGQVGEAVGTEIAQVTDAVPGVDALPADLGAVVEGAGDLGPGGPSAP